MKCNRCGTPLEQEEAYNHHGKILCEDCYMYLTNPPKACDPTAVAAALKLREQLGQTGASGLTPLQKQVYDLIVEKGKITREELVAALGIKPEELEQQFAVLRHCELVRAAKEGGKTYLTKW